jgi:hypothetical protein
MRAKEVRTLACAHSQFLRHAHTSARSALQILDAVSAAVAAGASAPAGAHALSSLADAFWDVRTKHPDEWAIYNLASVALAQALQPLAEHFAGWSPLASPAHGVKELAAWRPLLESPAGARAPRAAHMVGCTRALT